MLRNTNTIKWKYDTIIYSVILILNYDDNESDKLVRYAATRQGLVMSKMVILYDYEVFSPRSLSVMPQYCSKRPSAIAILSESSYNTYCYIRYAL